MGVPNEVHQVNVVNGQFIVRLDFGPLAHTFTGGASWLQIEVRTSGGSPPPEFTLLTPRPWPPSI